MPNAATNRRRANKNATLTNAPAIPSHEEVARLAYELFLERGGAHGRDIEDWLEAEQEANARLANRES